MGSSCCVWLLLRLVVLLLPISGSVVQTHGLGIGINYGQIANNLPTPSRVATMLQSLNISRVKLYDADPKVLLAFANTNVEFIVGLGNDLLKSMSDLAKARNWVQQHVQTFLPQTRITCILVGNEVFQSDPELMSSLLPAMQMVYNALVSLGLDKQVTVTSAHSLNVLASSYPPSSGTFREDIAVYMHPLLNFHSEINSPFLVNAYPYFAYKGSPNQVSLEYVLFQPNQGMTDPATNLVYDNMLYAQIDAVYAAIKAMGHTDIQVRVSETGWPSKGDSDEAGANPENAGLYNGNLLRRIQEKQSTPGKPSVPVDIYVFALFNEDLKPGPTSERNYGLYYPDGSPVYNAGLQGHAALQGYLPVLTYSSATKLQALSVLGALILFTTYLI